MRRSLGTHQSVPASAVLVQRTSAPPLRYLMPERWPASPVGMCSTLAAAREAASIVVTEAASRPATIGTAAGLAGGLPGPAPSCDVMPRVAARDSCKKLTPTADRALYCATDPAARPRTSEATMMPIA